MIMDRPRQIVVDMWRKTNHDFIYLFSLHFSGDIIEQFMSLVKMISEFVPFFFFLSIFDIVAYLFNLMV